MPGTSFPSIHLKAGEIIDDLRVYVVEGQTPRRNINSSKRPTMIAPVWKYHPQTQLPSVAVIVVTPRENPEWELERRHNLMDKAFYDTALHELGHTLGIGQGTLWESRLEEDKSGWKERNNAWGDIYIALLKLLKTETEMTLS